MGGMVEDQECRRRLKLDVLRRPKPDLRPWVRGGGAGSASILGVGGVVGLGRFRSAEVIAGAPHTQL